MAWWNREPPTTLADYPSKPSRAARREQRQAERDAAAAARRRAGHLRAVRDADRAGWAAHDKRDRARFGD